MPINLRLFSFRTIVVLTIFLVVSVISFFALYIFNIRIGDAMYNHAEEDIYSVLSIVQNHYIHSATTSGGQVLHPLLQDLSNNSHLQNTYLINRNDSLVYLSHHNPSPAISDSTLFQKMSTFEDDITIRQFRTGEAPFLRAYIRLENSPKCYSCHSTADKYLGMLVFDISLSETYSNIAKTRNFSIIYSGLIVAIILFSVFLVHYRFVNKSLHKFHQSINLINRGNLDERLSIPNSRELGNLSKSFNTMLDKFKETRTELQLYHEQEINNKSKMATIGEMSSRLAHEIRNPLMGIANATEILVNQMPEDEYKPVLEEIRRQAKRVNNAISNMLRFSHPKDLNSDSWDINETINALVFFIKNQVHNKTIEFRKEFETGIPLFKFDHEQIENALLNIGLNAIQSIKSSGIITFKTSFKPLSNKVIITIEDTGSGIPGHLVDKVFNPFFTTRTEGTGLGLAIVKDIIDKHHGTIHVESEISKGTIFIISLPCIS